MSKIISKLILPCILAFSLFACGKGPIPTTSPTPDQTGSVSNTPVPGDLVITNTNAFMDKFGTYRIVGMLVNNTNNVLTGIKLGVEIKDEAGNSLLKENGNPVTIGIFHPMLKTLAPGEVSPFEYSFDNAISPPSSYDVKIQGYQSGEANRANLTAEIVQLSDNGSGWYYLTGELVNKGAEGVQINDLAGAVLDSSNNVLSADWTAGYVTQLTPNGDPAGGDRTPFEINFPNPGGTGTPAWSLYWDADVVSNVTTSLLTTTITNGYVDQNGAQHVVGWVLNHSNQILTGLVVSGLYGENGNVLDASYFNNETPIPAGGSLPFNITNFSYVDNNQTQASQVRTFTSQIDPADIKPVNYKISILDTGAETVQKEGTSWIVNGTITNTSDQDMSSIIVVVSIKDTLDNLVATDYTTIFPTGSVISPGETYEYSVLINLDPTIDSSMFTSTTSVIGEISP
jgi:hypothetical protein